MTEQEAFYEKKLRFEMDPSDLFHAMKAGEDMVPVDTRQTFGYKAEHIPNAISLPHSSMTVETTRHLDKEKTYICYCDGIGCNGSTKGALKMTKLGFKVKELKGGIEWWKIDGYETFGEKPFSGASLSCAC